MKNVAQRFPVLGCLPIFPLVCLSQFANVVVQHTTLSLMSFLLKRAQRNMELCLDRSVWLASDLYTPATMQDFTQQYREALGKVTHRTSHSSTGR